MTDKKKIETPCKFCVFAKYDGKTQTDCELGLLKKYREYSTQIIEAYDEESEFFVIDKVCLGHRGPEWKKRNQDQSTLAEQVLNKIREVKMPLLVLMPEPKDWHKFRKSIQSLLDQTHQPKELVIYNKWLSPQKMTKILEEMIGTSFRWRIETVIEDNPDIYRYIDRTVKNKPYGYYAILKEDTKLNPDTFIKIGDIATYGNNFGMVELDGLEVYPITVHFHLNENRQKPLKEKIKEKQWPVLTKL